MSTAATTVKELQFQLDISRKMEKTNVKLIEDQYQTIQQKCEEILHLNIRIKELEYSLNEESKLTQTTLQIATEYSERLEKMRLQNMEAEKKIEELQRKTDHLNVVLETYKGALRHAITLVENLMAEDENEEELQHNESVPPSDPSTDNEIATENFPKDLLDQFTKLNFETKTDESLDDEIFNRELTRRLTCKICLSDVERHRCGTCFKGICSGCHSKVKSCPHCRSSKQEMHAIILPRF